MSVLSNSEDEWVKVSDVFRTLKSSRGCNCGTVHILLNGLFDKIGLVK